MSNDPVRRFDRSVVYLHDGREIDLAGLTVDEAIAKMRALGITPDDVRETIHWGHVIGTATRFRSTPAK